MLIAREIALAPNDKQAACFAKAAGTARFARNWAPAEWQKQYAAWPADNGLPKPSQAALRRRFNAIKRNPFPWMLEVSRNAPRMALLGRLRRPSRGLSRKGSANRRKADAKPAKLHARIANTRSGAPHRFTTDPTCRFHIIGIEDLKVRGMVKNRHLSGSVADMGFFAFRRRLEYKAAMRGGRAVAADRFYPSGKTCSDCGHKLDDPPLSVREWTCPACGMIHDRDMTAAISLKNMAVSSTVSACGEEGSGPTRKRRTKPASAKQEVSFDHVCA